MPEGAARLDSWRRALFLFTKTTREEGPFYAAGYRDYYLEGRDEDGKTPDLFGFDHDWFIVADVTASPNKAPDDAAKYGGSRLPPQVEEFVAPSTKKRQVAGAPFVLTNVKPVAPPSKVNLVTTAEPAGATLVSVLDAKLKHELAQWRGFGEPPPSFGLSAVPESSHAEVRQAMVGVIKWIGTQEGPVAVESVVEQLLGSMYTSFSKRGRAQLRQTVTDLLADISKKDKTIEYDAEKKTVQVPKDYLRRASRPAFTKSLLEWTGLDTNQIRLRMDEDDAAVDDEE